LLSFPRLGYPADPFARVRSIVIPAAFGRRATRRASARNAGRPWALRADGGPIGMRGDQGKGRVGRRAARSQRLLMGSVAFPPVGRLLDVGQVHPSGVKGSSARSASRGRLRPGTARRRSPKGKGQRENGKVFWSPFERGCALPGSYRAQAARVVREGVRLPSALATSRTGREPCTKDRSFRSIGPDTAFQRAQGAASCRPIAGLSVLHDASPSHRGRPSPPLYRIDG
jgi:hypothetical protein